MSNSGEFISLYNELDKYMREILNENESTPHSVLLKKMTEKSNIFRKNNKYLKSFANLRNAIVHNYSNDGYKIIAEPHDNIVEDYKRIVNEVMNPPKALNTIAIRNSQIYTTSLNKNALDVMRVMKERTFTHVPVIEDKKLIGIFSENTIFSYVVATKDFLSNKEFKISEFKSFIPIDMHEGEEFKFVPKDILEVDVQKMFKDSLKNQIRLAVVFITESGKSTEKILGMITAWDVAGN